MVIGYGSVKKSDVTGSVTSVKTEALKEIPANSVEGLLQGRAAGLQVINSSQDPGAGATVRIRGGSSLRGSNAPLVVVDGFPLGDAGDLKQINPSDIVNMEILKDASASAIYGSRCERRYYDYNKACEDRNYQHNGSPADYPFAV